MFNLKTDSSFLRLEMLVGVTAFIALTTSAWAVPSEIHVIEASYGLNLAESARGNATSGARSYCDTRPSCGYQVSSRRIGDATPEQSKDFELIYSCTSDPSARFRVYVPAPANRAVRELTCPGRADERVESRATTVNIPPAIVEPRNTARDQGENLVFESEESTESYYRRLVADFRDRGRRFGLEDFNRTFSAPSAPPTSDVEQYVPCTTGTISGCRPDTFYSWGPPEKMRSIRDHTPDFGEWTSDLNDGRYLYMAISPVATFCYGYHPVRFHFRSHSYLPLLGTLNNGLGNRLSLLEWIIPSTREIPANLESISFGQTGHFDELVIEIQRRLNPRANWHAGFLYHHHRRGLDDGINVRTLKDRLIQGCLDEHHRPMTEDGLTENLVVFLESIFNHQGWLHTRGALSIPPSPHFSTTWKTFFNPE